LLAAGLLSKNQSSFHKRKTDDRSIFLKGVLSLFEEKAFSARNRGKTKGDVLIGQGKTIPEVCNDINVSEQTCHRWWQKCSKMSHDMTKQVWALQKKIARLRKVGG